MGRLLRIGIYVLISLSLYFWVTAIAKGCGKTPEPTKPVAVHDSLTVDTLGVDTIGDAEIDTTIMDDSGDAPSDADIVNYNDLDKEVEKIENNKTKPVPIPVTNPKTKEKTVTLPQSTKSLPVAEVEGKYMVVAGSFSTQANAKKHLASIQKKGFTGGLTVPNNKLVTVIAASFGTEKDAKAYASKLKAKGVDCYVKSK
jgi:cell division septation protein DedD